MSVKVHEAECLVEPGQSYQFLHRITAFADMIVREIRFISCSPCHKTTTDSIERCRTELPEYYMLFVYNIHPEKRRPRYIKI